MILFIWLKAFIPPPPPKKKENREFNGGFLGDLNLLKAALGKSKGLLEINLTYLGNEELYYTLKTFCIISVLLVF